MANHLLLIAVGILWFFLLVCGLYMLATRRVHDDRSRLFFALFTLASSAAVLLKMCLTLNQEETGTPLYILPLRELFLGQICRYLFALYPLEVARPRWLSLKRWMGFAAPWLAVLAGYGLFMGFKQTPLHSFHDLTLHIGQPDVVMRLGLLLFMFPIEFLWTLSYDTHQSSAGRRWLRRMTLMVSLIALAFIGNTLTRHVAWRACHACIYMAYILYVMYIELFVRLPVPVHPAHEPQPKAEEHPATPTSAAAKAAKAEAEARAERLKPLELIIQEVMEEQELWREPELMLDDLVQRVGSNRTYVNNSIHRMGYNGFKDYINHLRVEYIRTQLQQPGHERLQDLFFDAGYRSRGTAWRNFTAIVGCTPSVYEERQLANAVTKKS